ncbi:putative membrane protein [Acinetobacter baumannii 25878_2]|nr:hypothetical protein ABLAC_03190 [Acinetobacter baumannii LAC-4]ELW98720.1 hypothetical protein ACINNAV78_3720 [Acinetobacter baumannii Naval-78]EXD50596.1 putative membrane protein [Acinetobacter baumannii 564012]EXG20677.1 putative membrane protein [Acinetobacter baumannii 470922]EXG68695.1 putative membrane protein [Acinetobacter baumannii 7893]EXI32870.1 putative membrane protein [Acinetobacter baumannii 836190]EXW13931.1 putative membrane protein [Acinetobacter baumannii 25766_5]EYC8
MYVCFYISFSAIKYIAATMPTFIIVKKHKLIIYKALF